MTDANSTPEIVLRQQAKDRGLNKYYTGKMCTRGHIALRNTSSGACLECSKENSKKDSAVLKRKETHRAHYLKNKKEKLAYGKKDREENREKFTVFMREWRKNNIERDRATRRASQSKRRAKGDGVTTDSMKQWVLAQKKICYWCGEKCAGKYHVDHYVPLASDGKHEVDNFVISCQFCNLSKGAKDPYKFAASLGRLF